MSNGGRPNTPSLFLPEESRFLGLGVRCGAYALSSRTRRKLAEASSLS